jgi:hypothetical protein
MKMLQEDVAETTRDILFAISRQLANNSLSAFQLAEHRPPDFAVRVNIVFFLSLSCSLITALSAVLALQWVANYDMGLNTSSARKRALQRHTRFVGIRAWKVGELIASLPLLIFIALFLFFVGIADWLWHINQIISAIVIGAISIGFLAYGVTNVIGIIYIEAPFRTPISKALAVLSREGINWVKSIACTFLPAFKKNGRETIRWTRLRQLWHSIPKSKSFMSSSFTECEEKIFEGKEGMVIDSLLWIANTLEISPSSRDLLLILIKEFVQLPVELLIEAKSIRNAPWDSIFTILCNPYSGKWGARDYSEEELEEARFICKASSMISTGIKNDTIKAFHKSMANIQDDIALTSARLACYRHWEPDFPIQSIVRCACKCISSLPPHYFHFILLNVQKSWPQIDEFERAEIFNDLAEAYTISTINENTTMSLIEINTLNVIFDLVIQLVDGETGHREKHLVASYTKAIEWILMYKNRYYDISKLHRSIRQQILARIASVNPSSEYGSGQFATLLDLLLPMIASKVTAMKTEDMDIFISVMSMVYTKYRYKVHKLDEVLLTGLGYDCTSPNNEVNPWAALVTNFDRFLTYRMDHSKEDYLAVIDTMESLLFHRRPNFRRMDSRSQLALTQIQEPSLALLLSWWCPGDWKFSAITQLDFGTWNQALEKRVFETWSHPSQDIVNTDSQIAFLRALITDGPSTAKQGAVALLERSSFEEVDEKKVIDS